MAVDVTEVAFDEGYEAYGNRKEVTVNPYNIYTQGVQYVSWRSGWFDHQELSREAGGPFPIFDDSNRMDVV